MASRRRRGRPVRSEAIYRGIAEDLRRRITSGHWPPKSVLPPIRALAAEHRVTDNTIRWALGILRNEGFVRLSPRRRLVVAGPEWRSGARPLLLEVLTTSPNFQFDGGHRQPYWNRLQGGIEYGIGKHRTSLLLAHNFRYKYRIPAEALELPCSGVLLLGHFTPGVLRKYQRLSVPVVLVDQPADPASEVSAVCVDNFAAAHDATTRLIALGHRRIAFFRSLLLNMKAVDPDSRERQEGYVAALKDARLPFDRSLIINALDGDTPAAAPLYKRLFATRPRVTAALTVDPSRAASLKAAAEARGLQVPRDFSIVSFQGTEDPGFSGPRVDFFVLGEKAVELCVQAKKPGAVLRIKPFWNDGNTIGPPAAAK